MATTTTTGVVVPLGGIISGGLRNGLGPRGWLFHLPEQGWVVMPQTRQPGGWRCEIIATNAGDAVTGRHVLVGDEHLESLPTTLSVGDTDTEAFALLWQTRVRQRFHAGPSVAVARILAEQLRPPGVVTITIGRVEQQRLCLAAHVRTAGLRQCLRRLRQAGLLTITESDKASTVDGSRWMTATLTLGAAWAGLPAARVVGANPDG